MDAKTKRERLDAAKSKAKREAASADAYRWVVWSVPADDYVIISDMPFFGEIYHVYPDGQIIQRGGRF